MGPPTTIAQAASTTQSDGSNSSDTEPFSSDPDPTEAGPPGLIVAGRNGISVVRNRSSEILWDGGPVSLAVDDLASGIVFQPERAGLPGHILWLPVGASEPEVVVGGATLTLHEVVEIGGSPTVVYTRRSGSEPDNTIEELMLHDLDTGESRAVSQVGGWEHGPVRVAYAGGRFLISMNEAVYTWFEFRSEDGGIIEGAPNPHPIASSTSSYAGEGALSHFGLISVYAASPSFPPADPIDLVAYDLAAGRERLRLPIGPAGSLVTQIDLFGQFVAVSREEEPPVLLEVGPDGVSFEELSVSGTVSILRSGLPSSADQYVGLIYDSREAIGLLDQFGGWVVTDPAVTAEPSSFAIAHSALGPTEMLWLEQEVSRNDDGSVVWQVLDVLVLPELANDEHLSFECTLHSQPDGEIHAIGRFDGQLSTEIRQAWRADREAGRFETMPVNGVSCRIETEQY